MRAIYAFAAVTDQVATREMTIGSVICLVLAILALMGTIYCMMQWLRRQWEIRTGAVDFDDEDWDKASEERMRIRMERVNNPPTRPPTVDANNNPYDPYPDFGFGSSATDADCDDEGF
jgi:hypothetical protein